ncbi:DUF4097 family beta strand repeat-containing protein [Streptomyces sp. NPDC056069]|uniref:DUF4097 family beta strand repeat-containing protein n=1 Tax=Streptomyces sp. NPDC056069 TaxID=3345702 RepID=UPI0035E1E89E
MQKFDTPAPITTALDLPAGRFTLVASDRSDTTVEVLPADASKGRDVKAAEQVEVRYADGELRIEAPGWERRILGNSGSVQVTVQLPAGSRVAVKAAAAELRGEGRLGDVEFESAQATVTLDETAGARVTVQAGDITVGRLGGSAEISTQAGDLRVDEAVAGTVTLRTTKGDITVGAARGVSATLDAGTSYGRIQNALRNSEGAGAALNISATTAYGDITARSL